MKKKFPKVYFDITIGAKAAGRIIMELYTDLTPKTSENFRGLCTGEYGRVGLGAQTKKLHYINTYFHRIVEGQFVVGGDITKGEGNGGASIYGAPFADENFHRRHACGGLLSMYNHGKNSNTSLFLITLKSCPQLDGKNVVFGQVCDGMDIIRDMAKVITDSNDKPKIPIMIIDCGQVDDPHSYLKYDPFKKSFFEEIEKAKIREKSEADAKLQELKQFFIQKELDKKAEEAEKTEKGQKEKQEREKEKEEKEKLQKEKDEQEKEKIILGEKQKEQFVFAIPTIKKLKKEQFDKLQDLQMKMNEARTLNNKAVIEEEKKATDPSYNKKIKRDNWMKKINQINKEFDTKGIAEDKQYLDMTANQQQSYNNLKNKKKFENFGNILSNETLYKTYKKKWKNIKFFKDTYEEQMENPAEEYKPADMMIQNLQDDIEKQQAKKLKFGRQRIDLGSDSNVTSINDRNEVFNQKLQRYLGDYAKEIKSNFEKGSAD